MDAAQAAKQRAAADDSPGRTRNLGRVNCAAEIGIDFIRNPQAAPDLSCLEQRREQFSLPGEPLNES